MLLRGERANSILEYAPGKMLVTTIHNQLLLFHDWGFVRAFNDANPADYKCWWDCPQTSYKVAINTVHLLPGFNEEKFPFVAWSRKNNISLVNIGSTKTAYIDPLVEFDTSCRNPQQAFFFREEEYGMSLHFTDHRKVPNG